MKKRIKRLGLNLILMTILLSSAFLWGVGTTSGLVALAQLTSLLMPNVQVEKPQGRLLDQFTIARLKYKKTPMEIEIRDLDVNWHLLTFILHHSLPIQELTANKVIIKQNGATHILNRLYLRGIGSPKKIEVSIFKVDFLEHTIKGELQLKPRWPYTVSTKVKINPAVNLSKDKTLEGEAFFTGDATAWQGSGEFHGIADLSIQAKGQIKDSTHGFFTLTISPGHFTMPENSMLKTMAFLGGQIHTSLTPNALQSNGSLAIDPQKTMTVNFKLPRFNLANGLTPHQSLQTEVNLFINSLDFLNGYPDIKNPKGQISATLNSKGRIFNQHFIGKLILEKASVEISSLGLHLNPINFTFISKENDWQAAGGMTSLGETIKVSGQGKISPEPHGELNLIGNNVRIINTKEYQIKISPQLNLKLSPSSLNLSGVVKIPYGMIKPIVFTESSTLPDDVIVNTKDKPKKDPFNINMDIDVSLQDKVTLDYDGIKADLVGNMHITQGSLGAILGTGDISLKNGTYQAYGQDLKIKQGHLIFTSDLVNPGINLRAGKYVNTATSKFTSGLTRRVNVGVEVTGMLSAPTINLYSNPSTFSQTDILSLLVIGRPANQLDDAGGQLLVTALSSVVKSKNSDQMQILNQLQKKIGVDLDFKNIDNKKQAVIGKALTERIYVNYTVGLSQSDPNVLTLKYLLTKFFSIQLSSSESNSGIDLLYDAEITPD